MLCSSRTPKPSLFLDAVRHFSSWHSKVLPLRSFHSVVNIALIPWLASWKVHPPMRGTCVWGKVERDLVSWTLGCLRVNRSFLMAVCENRKATALVCADHLRKLLISCNLETPASASIGRAQRRGWERTADIVDGVVRRQGRSVPNHCTKTEWLSTVFFHVMSRWVTWRCKKISIGLSLSCLYLSIFFFWTLIFFLQLQSLVDCLLTNAERQNADTLDGPDLTKNGKS
jgi:hypothetical protein